MDFKMGAQYRDLGYKEVAPVLVKRKVDILTAMKQIVDVECVVIWQVTGSRPGNIQSQGVRQILLLSHTKILRFKRSYQMVFKLNKVR